MQSQLTAAPWAADTVYTGGTVVTDPQGHLQKALTSGISGSALPAFNDDGGETPDGSGGTAFHWQDTGAGFVSIGRKHKPPPDLGQAEQPALFLVQVKEQRIPQKPPGFPSKLILHGFLILYLQGPVADEDIGAETVLAATQINQLLFAIDQALEPDDPGTGKFTIGGLVTHCWIEGDVSQDPGIMGPQCAVILPLHIRVD
jgi:hypothetical protein